MSILRAALAALLLAGAATAQPAPGTLSPRLDVVSPYYPAQTVITEVPASARLSAMGYAGVALPSDDPHAFLLNPAHLGVAARHTALAVSGWPAAQEWAGITEMDLHSAAVLGGADLARWGVPLYAGAAVARTSLAYPSPLSPWGPTSSTSRYSERYTALGLGVGTYGPVALSVGGTVRFGWIGTDGGRGDVVAHEEVGPLTVVPVATGSFTTLDAGALLSAPLLDLAIRPEGRYRPFLDGSVGYSRTGAGGSVEVPAWYDAWSDQVFPARREPVERMGRFGFGWAGGFRGPLGAADIELFRLEVATQAERSALVPGDAVAGRHYRVRSVRDDLDLVGPALTGRSTGEVSGRMGLRVSAFEIVEVAWGRFEQTATGPDRSYGWTLRPLGLLRPFGSPEAARFAARYDLAVSHSVYFAGDEGFPATPLTGATLTVRPW